MVNQSQARDPRFWAKWRASGALGRLTKDLRIEKAENTVLISETERVVPATNTQIVLAPFSPEDLSETDAYRTGARRAEALDSGMSRRLPSRAIASMARYSPTGFRNAQTKIPFNNVYPTKEETYAVAAHFAGFLSRFTVGGILTVRDCSHNGNRQSLICYLPEGSSIDQVAYHVFGGAEDITIEPNSESDDSKRLLKRYANRLRRKAF